MPSARAHINPEMLTWARQRLNADPERAARAAGTRLGIYRKWENGEKRPTIKQLHKVAKFFKRPASHFYLNEPPDESEPRLEMRRVFGGNPMTDSFEFSREVQECMRRREITLELLDRLGESPPELPDPLSIKDDPERIGQFARFELIDIDIHTQVNWRDRYEALRGWRSALEDIGVLSFQMSGVEITEARGFAIAERPLPVAVFNSKDSVRGRIFTLMHEFAHILLSSSTLHSRFPIEGDDVIEIWCNHVAAAILIPREDLEDLQQVRSHGRRGIWKTAEVEGLSRRYRVSPSAVIRRLDTFDLIAQHNLEHLREEFDTRRSESSESGSSGGGGNFYNNQLTQLGSLIPDLAFRSFYADQISAGSLSSIMGTKVENLGTFEKKVMGSRYSFIDA